MKEMRVGKRKIQSDASIQSYEAKAIIYLALKRRISIKHNDLTIK